MPAPTYNVELLEKVRDIIADEDRHHQSSWAEIGGDAIEQAVKGGSLDTGYGTYFEVSCPTAACVAGWAVSVVGAKMLIPRLQIPMRQDGSVSPRAMISVDTCLADGEVRQISSYAREQLGLTGTEADALFAAEWTNEEVLDNLDDIIIAAKHGRKWEVRWVDDREDEDDDWEDGGY